MHIVGFEPTLSYLRKWIMSPSLSTTQPYMPFRPAKAKFSSPRVEEKSIKAIKTGLAKTSAIFWVVFVTDGLSSQRLDQAPVGIIQTWLIETAIKSLIGTIVLFQIVFSSEQEKSVLKVYSIQK